MQSGAAALWFCSLSLWERVRARVLTVLDVSPSPQPSPKGRRSFLRFLLAPPKMAIDFASAHRQLWQWCRAQGFAGYDPYDALNSRLFQATSFKHSRTARLVWTQFHKRSPINLRSLVRVPRERNSKGVALFALAALAHYRRTKTKEAEIEAREL